MAKRSNNSLGRRAYGGKPYDANNSFVKKMATKVTDFIPQRSWISKWFVSSAEDNGETNECENPEEGDTEEEIQPPASKRPRIRMEVTHPPGTFAIHSRAQETSHNNHSRKDPFTLVDETGDDFLEPPMAGPSGVRRFVASTPAVPTEVRNSNSQKSELNSLIPSRNNRASNGADDNSESSESTSGCSSLIPQTNRQEAPTNSSYDSNLASRKRMINEKLSFTSHLQSPRCLFLEGGSRESLSSRRPSFNASMMSNAPLDRTSALSSPFYTGNVTFGGGNALSHYKPSRSLFNSTNEFQLKVPRRTSVQVKPSKSQCIDSSGISQTAKRILEAMEYFSSPISDAKKIPVKSTAAAAGCSTNAGRKRSREEEVSQQGGTARVGLRHLTRELSVPTVPELLKLRRRQKLQDTTVAARKIVSAMSVPPTGTTTRSGSAAAGATPDEYHLRTEQDGNPKFHGKLRAKLKKITEDETPAPSVNLPRISLPITSLPSFEPLPNMYTKLPNASNHQLSSTSVSEETFKFASPIKIREAAWNLKSINNFSFSKPLSAEEMKDPNESRESNRTAKIVSIDSNSSTFGSSDGATGPNFMWPSSSTAPRLKVKTKAKEKNESSSSSLMTKESSELKSGSVMDVLGSKTSSESSASSPQRGNSFQGFDAKSAAEIWECVDCYIKNDAKEKVCVACKTSRPIAATEKKISSASSPTASGNVLVAAQPRNNGFGGQFKMSSNQWECPSCLVRNQQTEVKCVACSTQKPASKKPTSAPRTETNLVSTSSTPGNSSLMDKFKPSVGSWECPGCMLRNPGAVITCPCCKAAKPSSLTISPNKANDKASSKLSESKSFGLMDKFKPAASSWECSSCMVRNNESASACVCCSTPKPATEKPLAVSGWGDKFKKPEGCWSCDSCLVQNKSEVTECVACGGLKPGASAKPAASQFSFGIPAANAQSFNFGIDKANEKPKEITGQVSSNGFSFGVKQNANSESDTAAATKFIFGMPKESEISGKSNTESATKSTGFVFAEPKTADGDRSFKSGASKKNPDATETTKNDEKKTASTFSIGLPKAADETLKTSENTNIFGGTAANGKSHFVFGIPKSEGSPADAVKSPPKMSFGVPSSESSLQKSTGFASSNSSTVSKEAARSEGSGSQQQPALTVSSSSSFAIPNPSASSTTSNTCAPAFTFSEPKSKLTSEPSIVPCFGQTSVAITGTSSTFPIAAAQKPSDAVAAPFGVVPSGSPAPSLGETPANAKPAASSVFGTVEKKASFFEMPGADKKSIFGVAETKQPTATFGSGEKPAANSSMFNSPSSAFGTPASSAPAASQPLFGNNSAAPIFGGGSVASFGTTSTSGETPSIFAAGKAGNAATANPGLFTFGATNSQPAATAAPAPAPAAFSFTGSATPAASSTSKSLFAFGGATAAAGANTTGTAFGTPVTAAAANPTSSPFTFNAPPKQDPPTGFGQATAPIPSIFGAQSTAASISHVQPSQPAPTGFNFGAAAPTPGTTSGVFSFRGGMSQPANAPSSGFNFNAPSASPAIAFDPNTRPSFNFTGGTAPTAFNATPQQPATTRKIKKAVRRMPQR